MHLPAFLNTTPVRIAAPWRSLPLLDNGSYWRPVTRNPFGLISFCKGSSNGKNFFFDSFVTLESKVNKQLELKLAAKHNSIYYTISQQIFDIDWTEPMVALRSSRERESGEGGGGQPLTPLNKGKHWSTNAWNWEFDSDDCWQRAELEELFRVLSDEEGNIDEVKFFFVFQCFFPFWTLEEPGKEDHLIRQVHKVSLSHLSRKFELGETSIISSRGECATVSGIIYANV